MTLVILNILVWLGPFFLSLRKGNVNTLHPQFIVPFFMVYFIINSYIQDQTNWMAEGQRAIIVGVVQLLPGLNPINFSFKKALVICLFSGIFFHLGSRIFNKPIYNSLNESIFLNKKKIINGNKKIIILSAITISSVAWLPNYFIPNSDFGTSWTFSLALSILFIPVAMFGISIFVFFITLFIAIFVAYFIITSKAAFAFIVIPMIFYFIFFHLNILKFFLFKRYLKNFIIFFFILSIFVTSFFIGNKYGKLEIRSFFRRDYSFEIFAILVESKDLELINYEKSWIMNEVLQTLPSIIYEKKKTLEHINPAKRVALELFPQEAIGERKNTYWNRHLLFAGYYDFGVFGSLISAFFYGLFFSFFWKFTKEKVEKYNAKWPILVYLPLPSFGAYFLANGGYAYSLINTSVASMILYIIFFSSRFRIN